MIARAVEQTVATLKLAAVIALLALAVVAVAVDVLDVEPARDRVLVNEPSPESQTPTQPVPQRTTASASTQGE